MPTIGRETHNNTGTAEDQYPNWHRRLRRDNARLCNRNNSGQRSDRIRDIIRTMRECHRAGRDDHQDAEYSLDRMEMLSFFGFRIRLDALDENRTDQCDHNGESERQ